MKKTNGVVVADDFLAAPAQGITVNLIDFAETPCPKFAGLYAVIIDNVLTPSECETMRRYAEASTPKGWERAMVNIGGGHQRLMTHERNCGRIIWDSQDVVDRVWKRIVHLPEVQEIVRLENTPRVFGNGPQKRGEVWKFSRPNERMRFLKYVGGEYFRPHCDGSYETPNRKERSYFTLHLYLNNATVVSPEEMSTENLNDAKDLLVGGATTFHAYNMIDKLDVLPKAGRILLFQHRDLLHSGDDVLQGTKYTMRTDLMYSLESSQSEDRNRMPILEDVPVEEEKEGTDGFEEAKKFGFI
jgi:hypothetical protein